MKVAGKLVLNRWLVTLKENWRESTADRSSAEQWPPIGPRVMGGESRKPLSGPLKNFP